MVLDDTISVRFEKIQEGSAILRLDAGVATTNFQEFLAVAEELNLGIVDIGQQAGATFAGPGRLVQMADTDAPAQPQV
jgi:MscS family membrane protein